MPSREIDRDLVKRISRSTVLVILALAVIALFYIRWAATWYITRYFLLGQDLPTLIVIVLFALSVHWALKSASFTSRLSAFMAKLERVPIWAIAAGVAVVGLAGAWGVFHFYPLSMDEFWARADGRILAHGAPMAHIRGEWLPYASALQPVFLRLLPHAALWSSLYLPVNALMQMVLGPLAGPLLAALSVVLVASVARQLMPERPSAPLLSALLLASSTQLLLTAMTPYAMTAHLAFNLAWLWLFLRRSPAAELGALAVGFLATGLHQFAFFPLFALPFLAEDFFSGGRKRVAVHGLAIAMGVLAWSNYDGITAAFMGVTPAPGAARNTGELFDMMLRFVRRFDLAAVGMMAVNLLRFVLWQNPIAIPLVFAAGWPVARLGGPLRAAMAGIVVVPVFMLFVLPYQGHGWGYRYLHGELGSVALLATYGWFRIVDGPSSSARAVLASTVAFSLAVLLPLRAYQAWRQAAPYVTANAALERVDADVVIIDAPRHEFSWDLVRNSPFLDNTPKRLAGFDLSGQQLAQLCKRYRVAFFTDADAAAYGIPDLKLSGAAPPTTISHC